jgi:hypothetical protein
VDLAARVHRADVDGERPCAGRVEAVEQAVLEHEPGAMKPFFAGLEHEDHRPWQVGLAVDEQAGTAEQHRDVGVVATGVHPALDLRGEVETGPLGHGQRVHVGPEDGRGTGSIGADDRRHRADPLAGSRIQADALEFLGDDRLGLGQLQGELRAVMDPAPDLDDVGQE